MGRGAFCRLSHTAMIMSEVLRGMPVTSEERARHPSSDSALARVRLYNAITLASYFAFTGAHYSPDALTGGSLHDTHRVTPDCNPASVQDALARLLFAYFRYGLY